MFTTTDIRYRIGQLRGDDFELFCCALFRSVDNGNRYLKIDGGVNANGKATKGTPDALGILPNGKYAAFQFTTQVTDERRKLIGDLQKISDPVKCPVSHQVEAVVLCTNNTLKNLRKEYEDEARTHGWRLDIYTLDDLTDLAAQNIDVYCRFFGLPSHIATETEQQKNDPVRARGNQQRFRCGKRICRVRRDTGLSQSEFVELVGFHSEYEFDQIERNKAESPLYLISAISNATGVSDAWLKHGKKSPYLPIDDVIDLEDTNADMATISELKPKRIYVCLDKTFFDVCLVIQSSQHKWVTLSRLFKIDVHTWNEGYREIPWIYSFLNELFERFAYPDTGIHVESRVLSPIAYWQLMRGDVHPKRIMMKPPARPHSDGQIDHWADDIRDIYHRFVIAPTYEERYGHWFIQAQSCFRNYISEEQAVRPWFPDDDDN